MACTMNITAILDNDLLFFHPSLSLSNFILGTFIDVMLKKGKKEPTDLARYLQWLVNPLGSSI